MSSLSDVSQYPRGQTIDWLLYGLGTHAYMFFIQTIICKCYENCYGMLWIQGEGKTLWFVKLSRGGADQLLATPYPG